MLSMRLDQVARIYIWETLVTAETRCSPLKVLTGLCMTSLTVCLISRRCHNVPQWVVIYQLVTFVLPPPPSPPPTPPSPPPTPPTPPPTPPVCYTFNVFNYNANETVTGTYTNCAGGSDSFSFTDTSGTSTNIGSICVLDGTTPTITSGNGASTSSGNTC